MQIKISNATEVKVGNRVKALMKTKGRNNKHIVIGDVWKVEKDNELGGTWISIKVNNGDMSDPYVNFMAKNQFNVMVPLNNILLIY